MKKLFTFFAGMLLTFSSMAQTEAETPVLSYDSDEYVVSYTNTFFDSGYVPTEKTMIVTKMRPMSDAGAQKTGSRTEDGFFGVVNSGSEVSWKRNNGNHDFLEIFQDVKYVGVEESAANGATYTFVLKQGEFKTYIENDGKMELYQSKVWSSAPFQTVSAPMYIGAVNDANNLKTWRSNALIYFFDIYEDGTLVKHFVPSFHVGEYCLHETISDTYAMNIGSGKAVACTGEHQYADVTVDGVTQKMCLICGEKVPFAEITIGETTVKYNDLEMFESNFYNISGDANVKLLGDIVLSYNDMIFNESGANISLDLNGYSIKGANDYLNLALIYDAKLTITGEGAMESTDENCVIFRSYGSIVVNDGTYKKDVGAICYVESEHELTINGGKFNAPALYVIEEGHTTKPIVKGGLFSMDPSDCVAEGYEVVANDDEVYKFKVVAKSVTPTAIESVSANKAHKTLKTIENGRVVIIRDGERYDIAGSKL